MARVHGLALFAPLVLIAGCSGSGNSGSSQSGGGTAVSVTITPTSASVVEGQNVTFQATVTGSADTAVNWQVNAVPGGNSTVGTVTTAGVYTAPSQLPNPATVTVTAVAQAETSKSASASVQILASNSNQQAQAIPVKLGTSGGNAHDMSTQKNLIYCCSGTLGALVQRNGSFYILSNNHVLARSDSATLGDNIIQPGLVDSNCSAAGTTTVGHLSQFVSLEASGTNVDAALAQIVTGTVDTSGSILSLGATSSGNTADPGPPHQGNGIAANVGEAVAKSGRSSGLTCSTVDAISVATSVSYQKGCNIGATFSVNYNGQISVAGGAFSASGDSGSLIVDENTADPVALLYAGSDTDTVGNPVSDVLSALQDAQGNRPTFVGSASTHKLIGCTLAAGAVTTAAARPAPSLTAGQIAQAQRALDLHAPELLANSHIQAIGVGASIDHPGEPAVLLVVNPGQPPTSLPPDLEGVGTRIILGNSSAPQGILEPETANRIAPINDTFAVNALSTQEILRAETVHTAHVDELMTQPGVQGVGITSSADAPGEAALMIFTIRGAARSPISVLIDGLRTRIRESSRFTAGEREGGAHDSCKVPPSPPWRRSSSGKLRLPGF